MKFEAYKPNTETNQFLLDTWFEHWVNDAGFELITDFEDENEWAVVPCITGTEDSEPLEMDEAAALHEDIIARLTKTKPTIDWKAIIRLDQTLYKDPVFRVNKALLKKMDLLDGMSFKTENIVDEVLIAQSALETALQQISENTVGVGFELIPINEIGTQRLFQIIRVHTEDQTKQLGASKDIIELADFLAKAKLQELYPDTNWSAAISPMVDKSGGFLISIDKTKFQAPTENNDE